LQIEKGLSAFAGGLFCCQIFGVKDATGVLLSVSPCVIEFVENISAKDLERNVPRAYLCSAITVIVSLNSLIVFKELETLKLTASGFLLSAS